MGGRIIQGNSHDDKRTVAAEFLGTRASPHTLDALKTNQPTDPLPSGRKEHFRSSSVLRSFPGRCRVHRSLMLLPPLGVFHRCCKPQAGGKLQALPDAVDADETGIRESDPRGERSRGRRWPTEPKQFCKHIADQTIPPSPTCRVEMESPRAWRGSRQ
jgi:hypothetical protein